ncbi:Glutamate synthase [NADPH] small chain [bacterium HR39]|nr:Glutamate synthase [NADPH] small chain [bacterium HR39]
MVPALAWLVDICRPLWGEPARAEWNVRGRHVVIGGDIAMHCVRTALCQGAASVTCL